jgi:hypothetical protein
MGRKCLMGLAVIMVVLLTLQVSINATRPRMNITESVFSSIAAGMSEDEVISLIGIRAGSYVDNHHNVLIDILNEPPRLDGLDYVEWAGNEGVIVIGFDEQRIVKDKRFYPTSDERGILEKCIDFVRGN